MSKVAAWHVTAQGPRKLASSNINLEKDLEVWIEQDPALLEQGLVILNRQMFLEGGRLDLLALDLQANFVVIEIKKGMISRNTVTQAVDYGACIASMSFDELSDQIDAYLSEKGKNETLKELLDVRGFQAEAFDQKNKLRLFVVGTGIEAGLERMVDFLSSFNMPISIVSFQVLEVGDRERVLVRELTESEQEPPPNEKPRANLDSLYARADRYGIGNGFRAIKAAAEQHGLYPHPFATSLMFSPPANRTRALFTIWVKPDRRGAIQTWIGPEVFAEFYPVTEEFARECLGEKGWRSLSEKDVGDFLSGLDRLFTAISNNEK